MFKKKNSYLIIILLFFLIIPNNFLYSFQSNSTLLMKEVQQIKYRPLAGVEEKEDKVYPSGSNAVGSPSTSGRTGGLSAGVGIAAVTIKNSEYRAYMMPVSVSYGISKTNDLSFSLPVAYNEIPSAKNTKGLGDLSLNINNNFLNQDDFGFGLGFGLGLTFPTGKNDISGEDNELDINFNAKAEKKIGSNSFNLSFGYTYNDCADFSSGDYSKFSYGVSYSRGLSNKFSCSLELNVPDIFAKDNNFTQILFLGNRYSISNKMSATVLAGKNIGDSSLNKIFIGSMSYSF